MANVIENTQQIQTSTIFAESIFHWELTQQSKRFSNQAFITLCVRYQKPYKNIEQLEVVIINFN